MAKQKEEETPVVETIDVNNLSEEQLNAIKAKIAEIREKQHIKRVFAIVVEGDEFDEKPMFIGYFRNPSIMHFSNYMAFVTKDAVQAALNLAKATFIEGDRELVDDDVRSFGISLLEI